MPETVVLQWDEGNLEHATRHGVSRGEINGLVTFGEWEMFANTRGRRNQRRIIGISPGGRLVTVVVEVTSSRGVYRPITSRPATDREASLYYERKRQRRG